MHSPSSRPSVNVETVTGAGVHHLVCHLLVDTQACHIYEILDGERTSCVEVVQPLQTYKQNASSQGSQMWRQLLFKIGRIATIPIVTPLGMR